MAYCVPAAFRGVGVVVYRLDAPAGSSKVELDDNGVGLSEYSPGRYSKIHFAYCDKDGKMTEIPYGEENGAAVHVYGHRTYTLEPYGVQVFYVGAAGEYKPNANGVPDPKVDSALQKARSTWR